MLTPNTRAKRDRRDEREINDDAIAQIEELQEELAEDEVDGEEGDEEQEGRKECAVEGVEGPVPPAIAAAYAAGWRDAWKCETAPESALASASPPTTVYTYSTSAGEAPLESYEESSMAQLPQSPAVEQFPGILGAVVTNPSDPFTQAAQDSKRSSQQMQQ